MTRISNTYLSDRDKSSLAGYYGGDIDLSMPADKRAERRRRQLADEQTDDKPSEELLRRISTALDEGEGSADEDGQTFLIEGVWTEDTPPLLPPPAGYHRAVKTYDNGKPVAWVDVADGQPDPEPMYLCTEAARIYMMSDAEYAEWSRGKQIERHQEAISNAIPKRDGQPVITPSDAIRYAKAIAADIGLAALAVVLFSPGLVGLSPADPSILMSSVAVASGVAIAGAAVAANAPLLASPGARRRKLLDVGSLGNESDQEPTLAEVEAALRDCRGFPTVGEYARDGLRQIEDAGRKRERISAMIGRRFPEGSLSWQRFAATLESVMSTLTRNSALVANQALSFDDDAYQSNKDVVDSGDYQYDDVPNDIQLGRYRLYQDTLSAMRDILNDNERLLLELDRFEMELANADSSTLSADSEEMLSELQRATSEMRYYSDAD